MSIREQVKGLAATYGTRDPFELCRMLGIIVSIRDIGRFRGYCINHKGVSAITVSGRLPEVVAVFVCAHELAHALLHRRFNRVFMDTFTRSNSGRYEREADKFAALLLYSEQPPFAEQVITAEEMANCLSVGVDTVSERLAELGIGGE